MRARIHTLTQLKESSSSCSQGPAGAKGERGERVSPFIIFVFIHKMAAVVWLCETLSAVFPPQGDVQSQAAIRAIARQVCEQLIQSK